jgi:nitroreductase
VIDTAVAMTTLELLLQSKGLSTCWGGYLNQLANHNKSLRDQLGIPENCRLRCALMVGYPDREQYRAVPYRPEAPVSWMEDTSAFPPES